jgi:hypothetical protein
MLRTRAVNHARPTARALRLLHPLRAAVLAIAACNEASPGRPNDPALTGLELSRVAPELILPGTVIAIAGESFVDSPWGSSHLALLDQGITLPLRYVDAQTLELEVDDDVFATLGGDGASFDGEVQVEVRSEVDGRLYRTTPLPTAWSLRAELAPRIDDLAETGVIFPNEPITIIGSGLLLRGEGESVAVLEGCFTPAEGDACAPIVASEVPVMGADPFDREHGSFAFVPNIAGIDPGRFVGTVQLRNRQRGGVVHDSPQLAVDYDLQRPIVYGASTDHASLGQYVTITGAGFVGDDGSTLLDFVGAFTADADGSVIELDEVLTPEFVDGHTIRYVINEDDALGQQLDIRYGPGSFAGTVTPRIAWQGSEVAGDAAPLSFALRPVRQVVWVQFLPSYVESLRAFGLRAVDAQVRARVLEVMRRDYAGIGVEIVEQPPDDWALFAQIDVGGPDPNGLGLLGYDNTPGKDTENQRLYDHIGGVNAQTQDDGFPGYGGVFIESLFGYSQHPGGLAMQLSPEPLFDAVFDPFRPDVGGHPVDAADLGDAPTPLEHGASCPASDRPGQIACAIWVLGSMVGSTLSHELGHSLGLADPYGPDFHDAGDAPDRLMDADRPFPERAELDGQGPARFCDDEYAYLRLVLPTDAPTDPSPRPGCF